jgi:hypothetical protein
MTDILFARLRLRATIHRPLAWRLISTSFEARLVSSMALARTREALHNGWDKNDPKDAQVILHMLRIGATQRYYDPLTAGINDVQELSKTHEAISKAKAEIQHRFLTHYLLRYCPKIDRFRGNSRLVLRLPRTIPHALHSFGYVDYEHVLTRAGSGCWFANLKQRHSRRTRP